MEDMEPHCPEPPLVKGWLPLPLGVLLSSPGTTSVTENLLGQGMSFLGQPTLHSIKKSWPDQPNTGQLRQAMSAPPCGVGQGLSEPLSQLDFSLSPALLPAPFHGHYTLNRGGPLNAASGPAS